MKYICFIRDSRIYLSLLFFFYSAFSQFLSGSQQTCMFATFHHLLCSLNSDNINKIHYKLGLNIYIGSYTIVLHISEVNTYKYFENISSMMRLWLFYRSG